MSTPRFQRFMTAEQYLREYEPDTLEAVRTFEEHPENIFAADTARAAEVARRVGEVSMQLPGENLPAYNRFVWALVYN